MRRLCVLSALAWATAALAEQQTSPVDQAIAAVRQGDYAAARGLVVDVREYGGGNDPNGWNILATLVDRPFAVSAWKTRLNVASFRAWNRGEGRYRGSPDFGDSDSKMRCADRSPSSSGRAPTRRRRLVWPAARRGGDRRALWCSELGGWRLAGSGGSRASLEAALIRCDRHRRSRGNS